MERSLELNACEVLVSSLHVVNMADEEIQFCTQESDLSD